MKFNEQKVKENDNYLIWLATGGMTHMLASLGQAIAYAKEINRVVVPLSEKNLAFGYKLHEIFNVNNQHIDCKINIEFLEKKYVQYSINMPKRLQDLKLSWSQPGTYIFPRVKTLFGAEDYTSIPPDFPSSDALIYTSGFYKKGSNKYRIKVELALYEALSGLSLHPFISQKIYENKLIIPKSPYIAVHFRNTDYENDIKVQIEKTKCILNETGIKTVFWATDDFDSFEKARHALPDIRLVHNSNIIRVQDAQSKNLHRVSDTFLKESGLSRASMHANFFLDVLAMINSTYFIPSPKTSISHLVNLFRSDKNLCSFFYGIDLYPL